VLRDAGVDLLAFTGFPRGRRAQVDFIPADSAQFKTAARQLKLKVGARKTVFLVRGDDRPGAIAEICEKLAGAGINMIAMDAVATGNGRYGAIFWVDPRDVNKAAKVLAAS
jgi:prephenate dehydratase